MYEANKEKFCRRGEGNGLQQLRRGIEFHLSDPCMSTPNEITESDSCPGKWEKIEYFLASFSWRRVEKGGEGVGGSCSLITWIPERDFLAERDFRMGRRCSR